MDDLSLDDLLNGLQTAQQKKSMVKLSERNVIELVTKLKQLGFFDDDLLHTSNGREFITRAKLQDEVATAIDSAGGRLPMVDLPSVIGVDLAHCERAADEVIKSSKKNVIQAQGELLTTKYFDSLAEDVNDSLQNNGVVVIGDLARRSGLGMEMLQGILKERIGKTILGRQEGGVLYTDAYLARIKAQLRGALRASLAPVTLASVRKDLDLDTLGGLAGLIPNLAEELLKEGAILGKIAAGGSFIPASFARSQQDFIRSFFQQNGYIAYDMAIKYGVSNPAQYFAQSFPDGVALSSAYVSPAMSHQVEAAVEEAVQSESWCDVISALPSALTPADAAQVLEKSNVGAIAKGKGSSGKKGAAGAATTIKILAETCAVSNVFLEKLKSVLCEEAKKAAQEAHAAKKSAAGKSRGGGGGSGGAAGAAPISSAAGKKGGGVKGGSAPSMTVDDESDDDWDMGKGKGKKGGKGGKKAGKSGGGNSSTSSSSKGAASVSKQKGGSNNKADVGTVPSAATTTTLSVSFLEQRIVNLHPDMEGAGAESDLPAALAAEIRPDVVTEYERALSDIFTAGAERRRRVREAASSRLDSSYQTFQLYSHGAELFSEDEATSVILQRHLVHTAAPACVDALLHLLSADIAEEESENKSTRGGDGAAGGMSPEEQVGKALSPAQRSGIVREAPHEAQAAVQAIVDALGAAATATCASEFLIEIEKAADAVGLRLRKLDKKTEIPLVKGHIATLRRQVEEATDAPTLLAVVIPLLFAKYRNRCLSVPGRALAATVESLNDVLDEEQHKALVEFHTAVVDGLKGANAEGSGGVKDRLEILEPKIRALV
ncbi:hypothetical protein Ndes2526B_g01898 [Nannochloris sp. 'desiccata']|nr:hypothetical protein KSW81_005630 [Chlorella desiccata (nom. nud.)]KAH7623465.1 putative E3 UFM1-protein ligase 1-like protein [Chlorella desiccata (nom. nud.)]